MKDRQVLFHLSFFRKCGIILAGYTEMERSIILFEIIGTAAFAISGALTALRHKTDLFGVIMLGIITATGGGVLRDVILGNVPPQAFREPAYVLISACTAGSVFVWNSFHHRKRKDIHELTQNLLFFMDSAGLGIYTSVGLGTACRMYPDNTFLCVFSGVLTGVGGGLLRDICVNELPYIFSRHIYALASFAGAFTGIILMKKGMESEAVRCTALIIFLIRAASAHYRLNLPKLNEYEEDDDD